MVWHRRSGRLTAPGGSATSTALVDPAQADGWVANWHAWLAKLGYAPTVRHVTVTVETTPRRPPPWPRRCAPAGPRRPAGRAGTGGGPDRPPHPAASVVTTRVSVTLDPAAARHRCRRRWPEQVAEFSRVLDRAGHRPDRLRRRSCSRRATVADTVAWVRGAFDPASRDALSRTAARASADWADAGPVAADERGTATAPTPAPRCRWGWDEAPRQAVTADVLARLIGPGRWPKRVTLVLTPSPAAAAARELDLQAQAAVFRSQVQAQVRPRRDRPRQRRPASWPHGQPPRRPAAPDWSPCGLRHRHHRATPATCPRRRPTWSTAPRSPASGCAASTAPRPSDSPSA